MFTLIYVGGFAFVILLLLLGLVRNRRRPVSTAAIPTDLPKAVKKRLGSTSTNRGLRALRWLFVLLSVGIYSFHVYWAQYAADRNDKFQELSYKDLRTRRLLNRPSAVGYDRSDVWTNHWHITVAFSGDIHRGPTDKHFAHIRFRPW
jgi:hypothetical protein